MPSPKKDETKNEFIDRCMSDSEAIKDFPDEDQRFAFCNSKWDQRSMKGDITMEDENLEIEI